MAGRQNKKNLIDRNRYVIQPMDSKSSLYSNRDEEHGMVHQSTLMCGRYAKDLGEYARNEGKKLKELERRRKKEDKIRNRELYGLRANRFIRILLKIWQMTFARLGEDWVFLAMLGITMALLSFIMDIGINAFLDARLCLYRDIATEPVTQFFAWVTLPVMLVLFAAGFVHVVAPQSAGSGIPEMKTILRGVQLKEYLTFKTLVAKVIGLTATLGSGMPLGKEGPFVHIGSIVAQLLSKLVTTFHGIYENESRKSEMLAAGCAAGVAACFAAPVGGVLFSIEVTTTYFAVRNYWRGFFASVCGASVFRLMFVWFQNMDTVKALFATSFTADVAYDPHELFIFALMGVLAGLLGAAFVVIQREYILFFRNNARINKFLKINRFLYPALMSLLISTLTFPLFTGQFFASHLSTHEQFTNLFSNFTWGRDDLNVEEESLTNNWKSPHSNIYIGLTCYFLYNFFFAIFASTMPIPCGMFIPLMKIGGAYGRLVGEGKHYWFPHGLQYGKMSIPIFPGGYAVVGSAAFSAAVTHSVSVGVILFEITGQITHIVPVMMAVLIANYVASSLQPSMYDNYIMMKKLPYMPEVLPSCSEMYKICVKQFMVQDVKYIWKDIRYYELKSILKRNKHLHSLPLVDTPKNMILLGSVKRHELYKMIDNHIGRERRLQVASKWRHEAEKRLRQEKEEANSKDEEYTRGRRPSRFEVIPTPDVEKLRELANNEMLPPQAKKSKDTIGNMSSDWPKKSILKNTNSFTSQGSGALPDSSLYSTVTGSESRIRSTFDAIFRRSATLQNVSHDVEHGSVSLSYSVADSSTSLKKVQLPFERVIDMSLEDQKNWEMEEMRKPIDLKSEHIRIDPSPFQLVEKTSILKVHGLFSMLGINHAYVTNTGRLVGVVASKELRQAINDVNSGVLTENTLIYTESPSPDIPDIDIETLPLANQPLLGEKNAHIASSMDSALSNSDNCSDSEMADINTRYNK